MTSGLYFPYPYLHSFVRYYLKQKNVKLFYNKKYILNFENPLLPNNVPREWRFEKMQPTLNVGSFKKGKIIKIIKSIKSLERYGFVINSHKVSKEVSNFRKQKIYKLEPTSMKSYNTIGYIPEENLIQFDVINNRIRLLGESSDNLWQSINNKKGEQEKNYFDLDINSINSYFGIQGTEEEKIIKMEIRKNEIPVGICRDERKLVCIQRELDPLVVGVIGERGSGKSIFLHALCILIYYYWGGRIAFLNDWNSETYPWSVPTKDIKFIKILRKINLSPIPLPCAYLTPYMANLEENPEGSEENVALNFCLNWERFFREYHNLSKGSKELDFGKSITAIDMEKILKLKNLKDIENYVMTDLDFDINGKKKIMRLITYLFNSKLIDISSGLSSKVVIEEKGFKKEMELLEALLYLNVFIIFRTKRLKSLALGRENALPLYLNYIVQEIYNIKDRNIFFKDKEIYSVFDELGEIRNLGAIEPVEDLVRLGRSNGLGFIFATQHWNDITEPIRKNVDYFFCFYVGEEDAKTIVKERVGVKDKVLVGEITSLEKRECYLFPKQGNKVITYDLDNGEREEIKSPIKIKTFPPLTEHKKPLSI